MTLLKDLAEAELWAVENSQPKLAARLRAHAARLRTELKARKTVAIRINGGPPETDEGVAP